MQNHYITDIEIRKIADYKLTTGSVMDQHRDLFLFSYYVGGLRLSEILTLKWHNLDGTYILVFSSKTKSHKRVPLSSQAMAILTKYSQNGKNDEYIFPVLAGWIDDHATENINKAISFGAKFINMNLSIIAKMAGIEKNISYHLSRHVLQPIY
jgi:integrase/recombinase XerD